VPQGHGPLQQYHPSAQTYIVSAADRRGASAGCLPPLRLRTDFSKNKKNPEANAPGF